MRSTARRAASSWSWAHPPPRRCPSLPDRLGLRRPAPEARSVASRSMPAARPSDDARRRAAIVAAGRRLGARGLISAGEGNLSIRLGADAADHAERAAQGRAGAPATSWSSRCGARETARARGSRLRPSSDLAIHRAVYAARPDVQAVVHAHLPAAMALTLAGEVPDPSGPPGDGAAPPARAVRAVRGRGQRRARRRDRERRSPSRRSRCPARRSSSGTARWPWDQRQIRSPRWTRRSTGSSSSRSSAGRGATPSWFGRPSWAAAGRTILRPPSPRPGSPARGRSRRQP